MATPDFLDPSASLAPELVKEVIAHLRLSHPLKIRLFPISGLDAFGARGNIRLQLAEGIREVMGTLSDARRELILDVRSRPTFEDFTYSITHTGSLGAFAVLPHDTQSGLGIDVESTSRVTDRVCNRVCGSPLEVASSPSPALLWTAKEASFKSLCHFCVRNGYAEAQPTVISEIEIMNWQTVSEHVWIYEVNFKIKSNVMISTRGAAVEAGNLSLSVAVSV